MGRSSLSITTCVAAGLMLTAAAKADDKDQYNLFNPTPVDKMRDFNTDRPTKSNVPYTVDAGHFQYEGDIFIYSYDNTSTPDTSFTSWAIGNPTFKLGLLNNVDFEVNFSAYNNIRSAPARRLPLAASATPSRASNGTCSATRAAGPPSP